MRVIAVVAGMATLVLLGCKERGNAAKTDSPADPGGIQLAGFPFTDECTKGFKRSELCCDRADWCIKHCEEVCSQCTNDGCRGAWCGNGEAVEGCRKCCNGKLAECFKCDQPKSGKTREQCRDIISACR